MPEILASGLDISKWQGNYDLAAARDEGFSFVIVKGGGSDSKSGQYIDSKFVRNYELAKQLGMPVGTYWYSRALTETDAAEDARYFYDHALKGRKFELPVYIDVEDGAQAELSREKLTSVVRTFCSYLEGLGYWVGVYSTPNWFRNRMIDEELLGYAHWIAQWHTECTYQYKDTGVFGMWQYGGSTNKLRSPVVAGVTCDQNYMYIDYPTLIREGGRNGYAAPIPASSLANDTANGKIEDDLKSLEEIADEVIAGKWGLGLFRRARLKKAGYDPSEVQKIVNRKLRSDKR